MDAKWRAAEEGCRVWGLVGDAQGEVTALAGLADIEDIEELDVQTFRHACPLSMKIGLLFTRVL